MGTKRERKSNKEEKRRLKTFCRLPEHELCIWSGKIFLLLFLIAAGCVCTYNRCGGGRINFQPKHKRMDDRPTPPPRPPPPLQDPTRALLIIQPPAPTFANHSLDRPLSWLHLSQTTTTVTLSLVPLRKASSLRYLSSHYVNVACRGMNRSLDGWSIRQNHPPPSHPHSHPVHSTQHTVRKRTWPSSSCAPSWPRG